MNALEQRIYELEKALRRSQDTVRSLQSAVGQLQQAPFASAGPDQFGSGAGGQVYLCLAPSSGAWGSTGTWPTLTPGTFTADVYSVIASTMTLYQSGATINNWFPSSPAVSKVIEVTPDGSGAFVTVSQSRLMPFSLFDIGACNCPSVGPSCPVAFTFFCCNTASPMAAGYVVNVRSGGVIINSGVTSALGTVTIDIGAAGTYTIEITGLPGFAGSTFSVSRTLGCSLPPTIITVPADYCCFVSTNNLNASFAYTVNGVPHVGTCTLTYSAANNNWGGFFDFINRYSFILWATDCTVEANYAGCDFRVQWSAISSHCDPVDVVQTFSVTNCSGSDIGGTLTITS